MARHRLRNSLSMFLSAAFALPLSCDRSNSAAAPGNSASSVVVEDWPKFGGVRGDFVSLETGILADWPAEGPPVVWKRPIGESYSPPAVAEGKIVIFQRIRDREAIECADARTGEQIWHFDYPTAYEDMYGYNNGPRTAPAIEEGRVYTYGAEGMFSCVDFATGKPVWQRQLNQEYKIPQNFFGVGCSPIVEGNLILLNIGGTDSGRLVGLDKATGKTVWETGEDGASYSTPVVREIAGRRLALFFTREGFQAVTPADGKLLYNYPMRSVIRESVNAASPLTVGDYVFLSATYNTGAALLKLQPNKDAATLTPEVVWKNQLAMQNHWATSIYKDGFLYGMDGRHESGSNFRCIDFRTGEVKWTADKGLGRASFIRNGDNLIAMGEGGELALIELNPERYIEKSRIPLLSKPCWTPPALSGGYLYVRNATTMACLDLRVGERR